VKIPSIETHLVVESGVVAVRLVELVERSWLGLAAATDPFWDWKSPWSVSASVVLEDVLERLSPLDTVVKTLETPEFLKEVEERGVGVS